MFYAKIAMSCLHGKPPQMAEYRRGLSRASNRISPTWMPGEGRAVPPAYSPIAQARRPSPNLRSLRKGYLIEDDV